MIDVEKLLNWIIFFCLGVGGFLSFLLLILIIVHFVLLINNGGGCS